MLDGVEVSRGPGSVAYGSDAFGGIMAARTRDVAPGAPLHVEAIGDYSVGIPGGRVGVAVTSPLGTEGGILVAGHYRSYGSYDSPDGEVFNSAYRDSGVLVRVAYKLGPGTLTAGWQGDYARDIDRPRNNSQTVRFFYPEENSSRFTLSYETQPVGVFSRLGFVGSISSNAVITDQYRFATPGTVASLERADVSANDFQGRGFAEHFFGPVRVEAGLDINGRYNLHALDVSIRYSDPIVENVNVSVDDAHRTDLGLYVTADAALLSWLAVSAGVRGDGVKTVNQGGYFGDHSTSNSAVAGSAALTVGSFGGFSATAQYAHGFRDPALSDRYFRGPSGRGFITGNPDLESETSDQYDLAFRYTGSGFRTAFYMYDYQIINLIERYAGENPDDFFFRNRGEAQLQGLELEAQVDLPEGFGVALAGQIERGVTVDDDLPLDDIPPESLTCRCESPSVALVQARGVFYATTTTRARRARPAGLRPPRPRRRIQRYPVARAPGLRPQRARPPVRREPGPARRLAPGISATFTAFLRF